jgi:hypothetical protein
VKDNAANLHMNAAMTDASRVRMACLAAPASHLHKHGPAGCFLSPHSYIFGYILRNDLIVYLYYFICIYLFMHLFILRQPAHITRDSDTPPHDRT